ncbi:MarR family winged helix-turn-helix transcriptional regulator [Rathayibacter tanaceti]|uniref:MarR family protein n=2 Tax=Rathayibacter tanaceti TaxID=1671680 RepID=A0A168G7A2_9MICO|nr:MarR family transcriptional regulator [Rathayibacter tanaceti]KZX21835.1 MarR family protein [Rathayibacter tanaceti]QHC56742.1 MarR family transcriptional regulator [Rathayibacter tanaceti]TCO32964.1 DNA-binding MarR family transcriptional regulator [Rathayibacter tanaceti]
MAFPDDATEVRAQGWRTLALFHDLIAAELGGALHEHADLSVVEYTLLDVLSRQVGEHHLRMNQVARATALSPSATTRLVARLEARGLLTRYLCVDDRRGIYTELTPAGHALLDHARPHHDTALRRALREAEDVPELQALAQNFSATS